jgi:Acylphosphatase/Phosphotransferase enzyme family
MSVGSVWLSQNSERAEGQFVAMEIRVRGLVQGVGFHPTVWRIARELELVGEVLNDSDGVLAGHFRDVTGGPLALRLRGTRLGGGQSNPTFLLEAAGGSCVLRKKLDGPLLPSAHAIEREYRVFSALKGGPVPTPAVFCLCEDSSVAGASFFVMEHVGWRIFFDPTLRPAPTP